MAKVFVTVFCTESKELPEYFFLINHHRIPTTPKKCRAFITLKADTWEVNTKGVNQAFLVQRLAREIVISQNKRIGRIY